MNAAYRHLAIAIATVLMLAGDAVADEPSTRDDDLWAALAHSDAAQADRAAKALLRERDRAVALLARRLLPAPALNAQQMHAWIADLENDRFEVRERASAELEKLGEQVEVALRLARAANPSLETLTRIDLLLAKIEVRCLPADVLRGVRAVEVLEDIGTPAATGLLDRLAQGEPGAPLTREARTSLDRLLSALGS